MNPKDVPAGGATAGARTDGPEAALPPAHAAAGRVGMGAPADAVPLAGATAAGDRATAAGRRLDGRAAGGDRADGPADAVLPAGVAAGDVRPEDGIPAGARSRRSVLLRLHPAVYDAVARWAADDLRSVNAQIEYLLRRELDAAGRLPSRPGALPRRGRPPGRTKPPDAPGTTA